MGLPVRKSVSWAAFPDFFLGMEEDALLNGSALFTLVTFVFLMLKGSLAPPPGPLPQFVAKDLEELLEPFVVLDTPSTLGGDGKAVPDVNQSSLDAPKGSFPAEDEEAKGSLLPPLPPKAFAKGSFEDDDAAAAPPKGSFDEDAGALGIGGGLKLFFRVKEKGSPLLLIMEAGPEAGAAENGSVLLASPKAAGAPKGSFDGEEPPAVPNALVTGPVKGSALSLKGSAPLMSNGSPYLRFEFLKGSSLNSRASGGVE